MAAAYAQDALTGPPAEHAPPTDLAATTMVTDEVTEGLFPPFNPEHFASQLLWLAITFIIFYYVMKRVALPRIGGILEDRRDRIASDLDHAQRLKEQSDEAIAAYEQALTEARGKAFGIAEESRQEAAAALEARRVETEAELDKRLEAAEARIGEIKAQAMAGIGEIAVGATEAVVDRLLGASAPGDEIGRAVTASMRERGIASGV